MPYGVKRESGLMPERSRHCNQYEPYMTTEISGRDMGRKIWEPGNLPEHLQEGPLEEGKVMLWVK